METLNGMLQGIEAFSKIGNLYYIKVLISFRVKIIFSWGYSFTSPEIWV